MYHIQKEQYKQHGESEMRYCGVIFLVFTLYVYPAIYYIDPINGSNSNTGLSESDAWKSLSKALVSDNIIKPGDTIYLREGIYKEAEIYCRIKGDPNNPVTITNYPKETPIVSGFISLTGWTQCSSQEDAQGSPYWENIYKIETAEEPLRLLENGTYAKIAEWPKQPQGIWSQESLFEKLSPEECMDSLGQETLTNFLIDHSFLTQPDDYWNGAKVRIWVHKANNFVYTRKIQDYISSEHKLIFDQPLPSPLSATTGSSPDGYAIYNHPSLLTEAGEYFYTGPNTANKYTIYYWPRQSSNLAENKIYIPRNKVLLLYQYGKNALCNVIFRNIEFCGYAYSVASMQPDQKIVNLTFQNCHFHDIGGGLFFTNTTNLIIDNCTIRNCFSSDGLNLNLGSNTIVKNSTIENTYRSRIFLQSTNKCEITGNTVINNYPGMHGNGIAIYSKSSDVLVARNRIFVPIQENSITTQFSSNITIWNNLLTTYFSEWDAGSGYVNIINNTILGRISSIKSQCKLYNNIIGTGLKWGVNIDAKNNIYLNLGWNQSSRYNWQLEEGGIIASSQAQALFENPANQNYQLKDDSIAIDAGTNVSGLLPKTLFNSFNFDIDNTGNPRLIGGKIDIGAYEYNKRLINKTFFNGQILNFLLDDNYGTTVTDVNSLQTGSLIGGPLWGTGWRDEDWLIFNHSAQAITIPTMGMSPQAGTIAVWVTPTDFSGMKFIFGHVFNNTNRLSLYTVADSLAVGLGSKATLKTNITTLPLGQPVHLALSWDGKAYAVYVNGEQKTAGTFSGLTALNTFIDIGNYGNPASRTLGFAGKIDDIRIFNRALSAEEIDTLYLTHNVRQGKQLQFTVNAVNDQGIPIVYQAAAMPAGASFDTATQLVTWTPWYNQLGPYTFRFTAAGQADKVVRVEVHPSSLHRWYTLAQEPLQKIR